MNPLGFLPLGLWNWKALLLFFVFCLRGCSVLASSCFVDDEKAAFWMDDDGRCGAAPINWAVEGEPAQRALAGFLLDRPPPCARAPARPPQRTEAQQRKREGGSAGPYKESRPIASVWVSSGSRLDPPIVSDFRRPVAYMASGALYNNN